MGWHASKQETGHDGERKNSLDVAPQVCRWNAVTGSTGGPGAGKRISIHVPLPFGCAGKSFSQDQNTLYFTSRHKHTQPTPAAGPP
jgi:hypothetical protein